MFRRKKGQLFPLVVIILTYFILQDQKLCKTCHVHVYGEPRMAHRVSEAARCGVQSVHLEVSLQGSALGSTIYYLTVSK